jgi:hypothetical protein
MMKQIDTYGGQYAQRNLTVADNIENKAEGMKMTQTTVTNAEEAGAALSACINMFSMVSEDIHKVCAGAPNTYAVAAVMMTSYVTNDENLREAVQGGERCDLYMPWLGRRGNAVKTGHGGSGVFRAGAA